MLKEGKLNEHEKIGDIPKKYGGRLSVSGSCTWRKSQAACATLRKESFRLTMVKAHLL